MKKIIRIKNIKDPVQKSRARREAVENGYYKLRNGLYASIDALTVNIPDMKSIIPGGIICLYSAWAHYDMTTKVPKGQYVAIDRNRKAPRVGVISVIPVYQSSDILGLGVTKDISDGHVILIYDRERCVCDAIKYRNKIGLDVMQEIIDSYLKWDGKNINKLFEYSRKLRVYNKLKSYIEVLI